MGAGPFPALMLFVGLDDTDSRLGGCTTALADAVRSLFPHLDAAAPPRLVRLNPNVPWKTRGNAAIAVLLEGEHDLDDALARVVGLVEKEARREEGTSPGVVVSDRPLAPDLYDAAVTRVVERAEADAAIAEAGARAWGGRGVIGAAAALAWPAERVTWERIAYRHAERIGQARDVEDPWAREVEWGYASTFDSYDLVERQVVCVPSSPCPVLWGIRGSDPKDLERASAILGPERPARETLFLTNQGTDDHLRDRRADEAKPLESARVRGLVASDPVEKGGSVFLTLADESGRLRAAAYAPTRSFRALVRGLAAGDEVTIAGGVHEGPDGALTLGIEKLCVHQTAPRRAGNPTCPACGRAMKSAGRGAGFRCRGCGTKAAAPRTAEARVRKGWHEVPASARRHLAMPLKRMPKEPASLP